MRWDFGKNGEGRHFAALLLFLGVLQIAGYYLAGALVNGPGPLAIPQPDTPLYCQAAARAAEGHPFSFSAGSAVCTGTTSVLYPFVLAIPHVLGFRGPSLVTAGFWLNAGFYLIFLLGWGCFVWKRFADPGLRLLAGVLLALFPQTAYCALSQSDIGFWLAVSGLLAAALAADTAWGIGLLLVLAPWVRPEGLVCVAAFAGAVGLRALLHRSRPSARHVIAAAAGIGSVLGVFAFNWMLTGQCQFASVSGKGYFATQPFAAAVHRTACDFIFILKGILFGQATASPRWFYSVPLLGALLAGIGVFAHDWRERHAFCEHVLLLTALGGLLTVAQSGWQNTNVDRYLAWIMPLTVIFTAEGAVAVYRKIGRRSAAAWLVPILPIAFSAASIPVFLALFHSCSEASEALPAFGRELNRVLPPGASYGVTGWCGLAYELPGRRCAHVTGIYSPEFTSGNLLGNLEILKNEPKTRFDFWIFAGDDKFPDGFKAIQGPQVALGPEGLEVHRAAWEAFDRAAAPHPDSDLLLHGKICRARLDVGYAKDEREHAYEIIPRYHLRPYEPLGCILDLKGKKAFDTGRIVFGEDEMTVALEPGRDAVLVMRTRKRVRFSTTCVSSGNLALEQEYADPLQLSIAVDGVEACRPGAHINRDGFTDAVFAIPGAAITRSPCRIALRGDHVSFGYWFYQAP